MKVDKIKYSVQIYHESLSIEIRDKLSKLLNIYYVRFNHLIESYELESFYILQVEAEFISLEQMFNFNKELEGILSE